MPQPDSFGFHHSAVWFGCDGVRNCAMWGKTRSKREYQSKRLSADAVQLDGPPSRPPRSR